MTGQFVGVTGPYSATYDAADVTVTATEVTGAALSIGNVVDEPAFGTATATFTVTLSAARTSPVTVDYATSNGTAIAGQDDQAAAGGVTFVLGQTTQTIPVTVIGGETGPTATFFVDLSNANGASFANNQATGTIVRKPPSVSGTVSPSSGGNAGTVTVTIQGGGLFGSPTVALTAPGEPDIVAQSTAASRDGSACHGDVRPHRRAARSAHRRRQQPRREQFADDPEQFHDRPGDRAHDPGEHLRAGGDRSECRLERRAPLPEPWQR